MPYIDETYLTDLREKFGATPDESGSFDEDGSWVEVYRKIQRLSAVSERSCEGLRSRLVREGYDADDVERALVRACSYGIVDDLRYAESLVRGRLAAGKGRRGIEAELRALAIDPECLDVWPDDAVGMTEIDRALAVLEKKPPTAKNKREAAYRRLIGKGYSSSAAQSAARIWSESS